VKPEVANLYTFADKTQTGAFSGSDERQVLNVGDGLAAALARLVAILNRFRAAIVAVLHPGIGRPEVPATLRSIGLSPSAEVVTWFGRHDGAGGPGPYPYTSPLRADRPRLRFFGDA
jgi:hypothetical protein